jgi:flagellar FliL protein
MSEAATVPAAAPAASNKMLFIMMGFMFVLLLGGMGGMYVMLSKKSAATEQASAEHGDKEHGDKKEEAKPKAAAVYVSFEPPFVVNFPAGSSVKFLQLTVQAMTRDEIVEKAMESNTPAIRDALLTLFGQQTPESLQTTEGKEALRVKALEALRAVMKNEGSEPEMIEAVYFTSLVMQ